MSRDGIEPGHWIAFEYSTGVRWYFGRVEQVDCDSPAGMRVQLEGAGVELTEVFPGALTAVSGGPKPHRYGRTDQFGNDPNHDVESQDYVVNSAELIRKLIEQYVAGKTHILHVPDLIETGTLVDDVTTLKFHGEETVRSVIKDLALRAGNASWGVDAERRFFFLQPREELLATYEEHRDLTRLASSRSRERLFNRVMLTGDYVYDRRDDSSQVARRSFRWRGNYRQPASIEEYGERRIRIWIPWIRTQEDSRAFVTEFFRVYAHPVTQYALQTKPQSVLPVPWEGKVQLRDRNGTELVTMQAERVRVLFDHAPVLQIELGPEDPRNLWPEPPHDERWELPDRISNFGGSDLTLSSEGLSLTENSNTDGSGVSESESSEGLTSDDSATSEDSATSIGSDLTSLVRSDWSSLGSSEVSDSWSSLDSAKESGSSGGTTPASTEMSGWSGTSEGPLSEEGSAGTSGMSGESSEAVSEETTGRSSWSAESSASSGDVGTRDSDSVTADSMIDSDLTEPVSASEGSSDWSHSGGTSDPNTSGGTTEGVDSGSDVSSWAEVTSSDHGDESSWDESGVTASGSWEDSSEQGGSTEPDLSSGADGTETWEERSSWIEGSQSVESSGWHGSDGMSSAGFESEGSADTDSTLW
ncbi:hypothetical protein [Rubinisphaera margarita]|uniref:hypothetical protein n=1 Tax=Rubinisphaera margarita TaxID=2909586 RepID=UPI001EE79C78|nr:hypothetical protein [Rubinisphaera margarita]MCG6154903.1 hypothetical protein [Rubinisphaera margarita]